MDFFETTKQYFNKSRKKKLGRPKFKKKGVCVDSFRIPGQAIGFQKAFDFEKSTLKIPKLKSKLKLKIDRTFSGQIKSITISKNNLNQYFVSVCVEEEIKSKVKTGKDIGLDLGLLDLVILSNGTKFSNPKYFRETQTKLKKAQQHLSRKTKDSSRYQKQKLKVAKIYKKITNQRNWYYHHISNYLVSKFDSIFVEDLNVAGMMKNRKLSKSIQDVSWSSLVNMISYKCKWYGKELLKIGRFFPSSKLCSSCGTKNDQLDLSVRSWTCSCGCIHDRDVNAAKNILQEGLKVFHGVISAESVDYDRGEIVRPEDFLIGNLKADFDEAINFST
jgi:putative transposase